MTTILDMYGFRTCGLCGKRMSLRYGGMKKDKPLNFVILERNGEDIFAHTGCFRKYRKAKGRSIKIRAGINTGLFHIEGEF